MWETLPNNKKTEYKRLILAFASLSEMFAQKAFDEDHAISPIVNSKFQETSFQRAFNAVAEDIGNTSYDASVQYNGEKYLVGIKTFGISSGDQKIAQFKAKHDEWSQIIDTIKSNAANVETKDQIDELNAPLYLDLAQKLAKIRNERIDSSCANIRGFHIDESDQHIHSVYHILMPSNKYDSPQIFVGETSYDKIDINNIKILGCTGKNNPTNFFFNDGHHTYKYTSADSQLHMNFENQDIICDKWDVKYADDAYAIFEVIANIVYPDEEKRYTSNVHDQSLFSKPIKTEPLETYCWTIWNKNGEIEQFSGFNSFYGTGSKLSKKDRAPRIQKLIEKYENRVDSALLDIIKSKLETYLLDDTLTDHEKVKLRSNTLEFAATIANTELKNDLREIMYRPETEMYIPIPDAAQFHINHPNFFGENFGAVKPNSKTLALPREQRVFNLVFEPSGDSLPCFICQDNGKGIQSIKKQTELGRWILKDIFQLKEYEPLTSQKLKELDINGLRFSKYENSSDIHMEFIWIDEENPPKGFIPKKR